MNSHATRLWISPPKFWNATQGMTTEQRNQLLMSIEHQIAAGDVESLRRFDFVLTENPVAAWRRERERNKQ